MDKHIDRAFNIADEAMEAIGKEDWENESDLHALRQKQFTYYHIEFVGSNAIENTGAFYFEDAKDLHEQFSKALPRIITPEILEMFAEKKIRQIGFKFDNERSFSGM